MIRLRDFSLEVGGKELLNNVDLDVEAGEWVAVIGPSGAGKSTFLRCLQGWGGGHGEAQLYFQERWHNLFDRNLDDLLLKRKVALLHQVPQLFPFSIAKNFLLPMKLVLGLPPAQAKERMRFYLEKVGLWAELQDRLDDPALQLSVGQKQRVALAQRLCLEPEILLLDEPTAALDARAAEMMLMALRDTPMTKVMITHHPDALHGYAHTCYELLATRLEKR